MCDFVSSSLSVLDTSHTEMRLYESGCSETLGFSYQTCCYGVWEWNCLRLQREHSSSLNRPQGLRSISSLSRTERFTSLMEQITGRDAVLLQEYLHVKFSNIRVKCLGLLLFYPRWWNFKDPVKIPNIPNELEQKPRRKARRGTGHGWAARVPINLVNDSVGRLGD